MLIWFRAVRVTIYFELSGFDLGAYKLSHPSTIFWWMLLCGVRILCLSLKILLKHFKKCTLSILYVGSVVDPLGFLKDPDPAFQLVSDPDPFSDTTWIFSNILDINFTFVFLPCKCVRLLIMTRYKLFRGIFFDKKDSRNLYF